MHPLLADARDKAFKDAVASAEFYGNLGTVLAVVGILVVVAAIPLGYWHDARKKAKKKAERGE